MEKSDKIIEILAWSVIVMILGFFLWINYELSVTEWDGMHIAEKDAVKMPITERL
jgi:hypothetical protein